MFTLEFIIKTVALVMQGILNKTCIQGLNLLVFGVEKVKVRCSSRKKGVEYNRFKLVLYRFRVRLTCRKTRI